MWCLSNLHLHPHERGKKKPIIKFLPHSARVHPPTNRRVLMELHPQVSSVHVNECSLFVWCKYGAIKWCREKEVGGWGEKSHVNSTALLPQSVVWIIYESADRRGASSTRQVPQGGNSSWQSGGAKLSFGLCVLMMVDRSPYVSLHFLLCQLKKVACGFVISSVAVWLLPFFYDLLSAQSFLSLSSTLCVYFSLKKVYHLPCYSGRFNLKYIRYIYCMLPVELSCRYNKLALFGGED